MKRGDEEKVPVELTFRSPKRQRGTVPNPSLALRASKSLAGASGYQSADEHHFFRHARRRGAFFLDAEKTAIFFVEQFDVMMHHLARERSNHVRFALHEIIVRPGVEFIRVLIEFRLQAFEPG